MRTEELVAELESQAGPPPDMDAAWETLFDNAQQRTRRGRVLAVVTATLIVVIVTAVATWPGADGEHNARVAAPSPSTAQLPAVDVPDGWHQVRAPAAGVALAIPDDWREFTSFPTTSTAATPLLTVGRASDELGSWLNTACLADAGNDTPRQAGVWLTLYEYPAPMATEQLQDPVLGDSFVTASGQPFGQVAVPRPADFTTTNEASPGTVGCSPDGYTFKDQFFTDAGRVFVARAVVTGDDVDKYAQLTPREILNTLQVATASPPPTVASATNNATTPDALDACITMFEQTTALAGSAEPGFIDVVDSVRGVTRFPIADWCRRRLELAPPDPNGGLVARYYVEDGTVKARYYELTAVPVHDERAGDGIRLEQSAEPLSPEAAAERLAQQRSTR